MITVVIRRARRVVRMRMIISKHVQPACAGVFFHPNLLAGIDQEPVSLRFSSGLLERQQFLGTLGIVAQIGHRRHFRNFFPIAVSMAEKNTTTLARVVTSAVRANRIALLPG